MLVRGLERLLWRMWGRRMGRSLCRMMMRRGFDDRGELWIKGGARVVAS